MLVKYYKNIYNLYKNLPTSMEYKRYLKNILFFSLLLHYVTYPII